MEGTEMEQMRVLIARQQAQLDQLQQQLQQQQAQQAQARQASPVGQDLSELRSIVDTRVMEKIPIFDGNEAHFAEWRFTCDVGRSSLSPVWRQGDTYQYEEDLTAWDTRITEYERDSGKMVDLRFEWR